MIRLFSYIFFSFALISNGFALPKYQAAKAIAEVIFVKGNAVAFRNFGRTVQYLKAGDKISRNIMLITRKNSQVQIKFTTEGYATLFQNTKITLTKQKAISIQNTINLVKGKVRFEYGGAGFPETSIRFTGEVEKYQGNDYTAYSVDGIKEIEPNGNEKIFRLASGEALKKLSTSNLSSEPILTKPLPAKAVTSKVVTPEPSLDDLLTDVQPTTPKSAQTLVQDEDTSEFDSLFGDSEDNTEIKKSTDTSFYALGGNEISKTYQRLLRRKSKDKSRKGRKKTPVITKWFSPDWDLSLKTVSYFFAPEENSQIDEQSMHIDGKVALLNKATLSHSSSFTYSGWAQFSNREDVYTEPTFSVDYREDKRSALVLNEFFYLKSFDSFDFTIGKKVYRLGKGTIFSPSDRISPSDNIVVTDSVRLGTFLTSIDYYIGDSSLTFLAVPYFQSSKTANRFSRWSTQRDGNEFDFQTIYPSGLDAENLQTLIKFETTKWEWDFMFALFNGPNPDPTIRNEIVTNSSGSPEFTLLREHPQVTNMSFGFSTTFGKMEYHGEILKQNAKEGRDDAYTQYMTGFRYTFDEGPPKWGMNQIDLLLDIAKETTNQKVTYPFVLVSSINSRVFQENIFGALIFKFTDRAAFSYNFNYDIAGNGRGQIFDFGYNWKGIGQINAKLEMYAGSSRSLFGKWDTNDNFTLEYLKTF